MKNLAETLADIGTSIEALNSPDNATRTQARTALANAYPNAKLVIEVSDGKRLAFPVTVNGKQYSYPLMNTLTAAGFANSTTAKAWNFVGFANNSKIGTPKVANTLAPIKSLKTVAENVDVSDFELELQKEEQKRVQDELYAKYMAGESLTDEQIRIIQGLIPSGGEPNEGGENSEEKPKKKVKMA